MDWWGVTTLGFGLLNLGLGLGWWSTSRQRKAIDHDVVAARLRARVQDQSWFLLAAGTDTLRGEGEPMTDFWWVTRTRGDGRVSEGMMDAEQVEREIGAWLRGEG